MMHQIILENIQQTILQIKKTDTNIKPYQDKARISENMSDKELLKVYKFNNKIEKELNHLANFLDNNMSLQMDEFKEFKKEISVACLKNINAKLDCTIYKDSD